MIKLSSLHKDWFSGNERYWFAIAATICGLIATGWYDTLFNGIDDRFTGDSASFIEAARSILRGEGIGMTPWGYDTRLHPVPLEWWPPGYPFLIAILAKFGFGIEHAAVLVTQWSTALAAGAVVLVFSPVIGPICAFLSASVIFVSPAVLQWSFIPSSDPPFLLLAIIAIGCFLKALEEAKSWQRWTVAGFSLGLTVWVRNVGIALIAAEISIVAIQYAIARYAIGERPAAKALAKGAAFFVIATLIPMLLLFCFNLYYFGTLRPYHAPPSEVNLLTNITNYVAAQFHDISGVRLGILDNSTGFTRILLEIVAIAAIMILAGWAISLALIRSNRSRASIYTAGVLGLYILFGAAIVIIARTRYEMGDNINERHAFQYSWAVIVVGFILTSWTVKRFQPYMKFAISAALIGFAVLKIQYIGEFYKAEQIGFAGAQETLGGHELGSKANSRTLALLYAEDPIVLGALKDVPKEAIIFTNFPDLLRVRLGVPARYISEEQVAEGAVKLGEFVNDVGNRAPVYVFFLLSPHFSDLGGSDWQKFIMDRLENSFAPIQQDRLLLIAQAKRNVGD